MLIIGMHTYTGRMRVSSCFKSSCNTSVSAIANTSKWLILSIFLTLLSNISFATKFSNKGDVRRIHRPFQITKPTISIQNSITSSTTYNFDVLSKNAPLDNLRILTDLADNPTPSPSPSSTTEAGLDSSFFDPKPTDSSDTVSPLLTLQTSAPASTTSTPTPTTLITSAPITNDATLESESPILSNADSPAADSNASLPPSISPLSPTSSSSRTSPTGSEKPLVVPSTHGPSAFSEGNDTSNSVSPTMTVTSKKDTPTLAPVAEPDNDEPPQDGAGDDTASKGDDTLDDSTPGEDDSVDDSVPGGDNGQNDADKPYEPPTDDVLAKEDQDKTHTETNSSNNDQPKSSSKIMIAVIVALFMLTCCCYTCRSTGDRTSRSRRHNRLEDMDYDDGGRSSSTGSGLSSIRQLELTSNRRYDDDGLI